MKDFLKYTLASVCGLLIVSTISCMIFFALMGAVLALSETPTTTLKPNSVYVLDMKGIIEERSTEDELTALLNEAMGQSDVKTLGLDDIISNIEKAKNDPNIVGIYLRGGSLSGGYASLAAIRDALEDFKTSDKFIVAYAQDYTQGSYYVASVADSIFCNEQGSVDWQGLYANTMFFTRALEKIGIEMQILKVGTFKSAVEPYMLTEMSDANRLQMRTLLNEIWGEMTHAVSESRGISIAQLNRLADSQMAIQAQEVLFASGLVDGGIYQQEMEQILTNLTGSETYHLVSHSAMTAVPEIPTLQTDQVAVLYATGEITDSEGDGIVGTKMVREINKLAENDKVKAVVLRVNSPGGSAAASEQIWHALTLLKEKKPLVVSMGDYAASGGYYISCLADTIIAEPNTLTGSIGIFGMVPNLSGLTKKIGIDIDGVGTNEMSDMMSNLTFKGMNKHERQLMQNMINRGYELFVKRCADGRGVTTDEIKAIAEGRVWSGQHALEIGLVDMLGNTEDAIEIAAQMANISNYAVKTYPAKKDAVTELLESLGGPTSEPERILLQLQDMVKEPTVMARLPYYLTIE